MLSSAPLPQPRAQTTTPEATLELASTPSQPPPHGMVKVICHYIASTSQIGDSGSKEFEVPDTFTADGLARLCSITAVYSWVNGRCGVLRGLQECILAGAQSEVHICGIDPLREFRQEVNAKFVAMDAKFDAKFGAIDAKIEDMDAKIEDMKASKLT